MSRGGRTTPDYDELDSLRRLERDLVGVTARMAGVGHLLNELIAEHPELHQLKQAAGESFKSVKHLNQIRHFVENWEQVAQREFEKDEARSYFE